MCTFKSNNSRLFLYDFLTNGSNFELFHTAYSQPSRFADQDSLRRVSDAQEQQESIARRVGQLQAAVQRTTQESSEEHKVVITRFVSVFFFQASFSF